MKMVIEAIDIEEYKGAIICILSDLNKEKKHIDVNKPITKMEMLEWFEELLDEYFDYSDWYF